MKPVFTSPDAWSGGNIDALIYFGLAPLETAITVGQALWSSPLLDGPYQERHIEPSLQEHCDYSGFEDDGCEQLVGVLTHPDGIQSPFVHTTICDEDGLWIYIGTPTGGLPDIWNIGAYPFDDGKSATWLPSFIATLQEIAEHVHSLCLAQGAIYGWDTLADPEELLAALNGKISSERWAPISLWTSGVREDYPATHTEPPIQPGITSRG